MVSAVLPFGLSLSPYVFTRLTNWLGRLIRKETGLNVAVCIDDFLIGGATREQVEKGVEIIRALFKKLGVVLSSKKPIEIQQRVEFLGFEWAADKKTVGVTEEKRKKYRRAVKNLLRSPQTAARWKTVIGRLLFLREAIGPTLRHISSIL